MVLVPLDDAVAFAVGQLLDLFALAFGTVLLAVGAHADVADGRDALAVGRCRIAVSHDFPFDGRVVVVRTAEVLATPRRFALRMLPVQREAAGCRLLEPGILPLPQVA